MFDYNWAGCKGVNTFRVVTIVTGGGMSFSDNQVLKMNSHIITHQDQYECWSSIWCLILKKFPEILWRLHLLWSHHDLTPVLPCCQRMWGCICWISKDCHSLIIWSLIVSDSARHLWYVHLACFVGIVFGVTVLLLSRGHYSIGDDPDCMQLCQKSMLNQVLMLDHLLCDDDYPS